MSDTWSVWGDDASPMESHVSYDKMKELVDNDKTNTLYGDNDKTGEVYDPKDET